MSLSRGIFKFQSLHCLSVHLSIHQCLSTCASCPVVDTSGPHNPHESPVSFFTVTGRIPRSIAPGLQTNSVWLKSPPPHPCFHQPQFLQERRQRKPCWQRPGFLWDRLGKIILPLAHGRGLRRRDRHAKEKNLIGLWLHGSRAETFILIRELV